MSGKEAASYHYTNIHELSFVSSEIVQPFPTHHEFPIPTYTTERPGIPLPETYEFLDSRDPQVSELLLSVFADRYFQQNLAKLQRKLHNNDVSANSRMGLENALSGFMFEEAAHRYLPRGIQGNSVLLTPHETQRICEINGLQENIKENVRTVPDGIVLQPVGDQSYIVGTCEYTIRTNLGEMDMPYKLMNKDKRKQLMQHTTGKVVYDLFTRQTPAIQKKLGNVINNMHPELPPNLAYDESAFKVILVTTTENDTPFTHEKCELVRMPLTSNDIWHLSMSIVNELQSSPAYFDQPRTKSSYSLAAD